MKLHIEEAGGEDFPTCASHVGESGDRPALGHARSLEEAVVSPALQLRVRQRQQRVLRHRCHCPIRPFLQAQKWRESPFLTTDLSQNRTDSIEM